MGRSHDGEFAEFISARIPQLRRAARLLCGDLARGDDVVQRTITDAYVHWAKVIRADNPDAYLRRMLVRRFLDERRLGWSRVRLVDRLPDPPAHPEVDPGVRIDLQRALMRLAKGQRAAIVLRYFYDLSIEQTAQCLDCSRGTVKSQTARGLATLRELLSSDDSLRSNHA